MDSAPHPNIIAIIGTYRKGGVIDRLTDAVLDGARAAGATAEKVYLIDTHIEFCTNCRTCTQEPGAQRGTCVIEDDMRDLLERIRAADALVLASPMNFWTVTAVMKRFIERLVCFAWWPWGAPAPKTRPTDQGKRAVVLASSAAPALLARLATRMVGLLKSAAKLLGARKVDVLFVGLSARKREQPLSPRVLRKARRLGEKLASRL